MNRGDLKGECPRCGGLLEEQMLDEAVSCTGPSGNDPAQGCGFAAYLEESDDG